LSGTPRFDKIRAAARATMMQTEKRCIADVGKSLRRVLPVFPFDDIK
jgi:hypothetical protein